MSPENHDTEFKTTFAVLGGGPGGQATAAYLALSGHRVNFYGRDARSLEQIVERGAIQVEGTVSGLAELGVVTTDLRLAIEDAKVLIVAVPGHVQREIAKQCVGLLQDGQIILLTPGRVFGAFEFRRTLEQHGLRASVAVAETQTIPFTCRLTKSRAVQLLSLKRRVRVAAIPSATTDTVLHELGNALPMLEKADDVLETSLNSVGSILHPLPTLMNLGWIETKRTEFKHYYEGISPSVARIIEQLDAERLAIGHELGVSMTSVREWLEEVYDSPGATLFDTIRNTACYATIDAPTSIDHRYLLEDVPTGLVPLASLAAAIGLDTPVTNVVIDLAELASGVDFRQSGRTMQKLGIDEADRQQLRTLLTQ